MRRLNLGPKRACKDWRRSQTKRRAILYLECLEERALPAPLAIQPTTIQTTIGSAIALPPITATGGGITLNPILPVLNSPSAIALDSSGAIFVANSKSNSLSKLTSSGTVRTFVPASAGLDVPVALAFDSSGNLYVANSGNDTVSKVTPLGAVSTFVPDSAGLSDPDALAFDGNGNLYVANNGDSTVSKVSPGGTVTSFLAAGTISGPPNCLAFDSSGNLYVGNFNNGTVDKATTDGTVSTFVSGILTLSSLTFDSTGNLYVGVSDDQEIFKVNQSGVASPFLTKTAGVAPAGLMFHGGNLFVADNVNNTVDKVTLAGAVTILVADTVNQPGFSSLVYDNKGNLYLPMFIVNQSAVMKLSPTGEVSTFVPASAGLHISGVAFDGSGNLYVEDFVSDTLEKVTPGGTISTFLSASDALKAPLKSFVFDKSGNLYIANGGAPDIGTDVVSKVAPDGAISTFVSANIGLIGGMAFDNSGNLYVSSVFTSHGFGGSGPILKVTPAGTASTFVPASANLSGALAFDSSGNLYVANGSDNTVEEVAPNGAISTLIPASAGLNDPSGLVFDTSGNLYVADESTVHKLAPAVPSFTVSAADAGQLAALGLTLNSDGTFSGTVTAMPSTNPLTFTVHATDLLGDSGSAVISLTVGQPGTISGVVFHDYNLNGVQDSGEPGLSGQALFLDLKNSGTLDAGDPTATTDVNGAYTFTHLPAGAYTLRQVSLGGVLQSKPAGGSYQVTVTAGGTDSGIDFANVITSISIPLSLPPDTPFPAQGNANADYVEAIFRATLDRDADAVGLSAWTTLLNNGASRVDIVQGISNSPEHFADQVDALYVTLLGRLADPSGQAFWVGQLQNGLRQEQVAIAFLNSPEYVGKGDKFFVDSMYESLLGRGFDSAGESFWLSQLGDDANGNPVQMPTLTHLQVVSDFLYSAESLGRLVNGYYEVYLQRQPDSAGVNSWVAALQQGLPFWSIGEGFLASDEFYAKAAANI